MAKDKENKEEFDSDSNDARWSTEDCYGNEYEHEPESRQSMNDAGLSDGKWRWDSIADIQRLSNSFEVRFPVANNAEVLRSRSLSIDQSKHLASDKGWFPSASQISNNRSLRLRSPSFRGNSSKRINSEYHALFSKSPKLQSSQAEAFNRHFPRDSQYGAIPTVDSSADRQGFSITSDGATDGYQSLSKPGTGGDSRFTLQNTLESLIYGMVNSILTLPCMYGYAAIIFRHAEFQDHMPDLAKLVLFSSVVHQLIFSLFSSLNFSIGQVQDAGLIFLSTMASYIANHCDTKECIVPTTLAVLAVATASLGVVVFAMGRLRLAKFVSFLPMPVVGGYLAFIGFFCLEAGVGLCIGEDVSSIVDISKAFSLRGLRLTAPAIFGGGLLAFVSKKVEKWYALPLVLILLPASFYLCLLLTNTSIAEAQQQGWMSMPENRMVSENPALGKDISWDFWHVWKLFRFDLVQWNLLPKQIFTWLSMVFVVSFSSCLDVVAIEMDMGKTLDIDQELSTVGLSNIVSGLLGGYTGSYIFSQTIFTFRTKTNSRIVGVVVFVSEFFMFVLPYNVMEYVPLFFFAATLTFIAFDLLYEWLVLVYSKVSLSEYLVLLGTFVVIVATNDLMLGILSGVAFAALKFIVAYSSVPLIHQSYDVSSNVIRDFESRRALERFQSCIVRFDLHGFLFFGSSVGLIEQLQQLLDSRNSRACNGLGMDISDHKEQQAGETSVKYLVLDFKMVTGIDATAISTGLLRMKQVCAVNGITVVFTSLRPDFCKLFLSNGVLCPNDPFCLAFSQLLDGLDWIESTILFDTEFARTERLGTSSSAVFASRCVAEALGSDLDVYVRRRNISELPEVDSVPYANSLDGSLNMGLTSLQNDPIGSRWLKRILVDFLGYENEMQSNDSIADPDNWSSLSAYFGIVRFRAGEYLFHEGDSLDKLYIVYVGEVLLFAKDGGENDAARTERSFQSNHETMSPSTNWATSLHLPLLPNDSKGHDNTVTALVNSDMNRMVARARFGSVFGDTQFFLKGKSGISAMATKDTAVFFITRAKFEELQNADPKLAMSFLFCLCKNLTLTVKGLESC